MKQLLNKCVLLLAVIMLIGQFAVLGVSAAGEGAELSSSGKVSEGGTITITVKVTDAVDLRGISFIPQYDESLFELVSGEWTVSGVLTDFSVSNGDGVIAFAADTDVNGAVATFTLKVKDGAQLGSAKVKCAVTLSNATGNLPVITTQGHTVKIECKHDFSKKDPTNAFLKSAASCSKKATYYYACSKCNAKGTDTYEVGETLEHTYDQKVVKDKFAKVPETCTSTGTYYYSCKCGAKGTQTFDTTSPSHKYTNAWASNADEHWHECSRCHEKKDVAKHVPGPEATKEKAQVCTVCNYVITPPLGHEHTYKEEWEFDQNQHWQECDCGTKGSLETHNWHKGETVTDENGNKTRTDVCSLCGYETVVEIDDEASTPEQTDTPLKTKPTNTDEETESKGVPWALFISVIILGALGWIAAASLFFKNRFM